MKGDNNKMSKMSQLHAELSEQAYKLGFESIGEAEQAGYGVDWENAMLIKMDDEQGEAHKAWLKERERVLGGLTNLLINKAFDPSIVERAINFIKQGEI